MNLVVLPGSGTPGPGGGALTTCLSAVLDRPDRRLPLRLRLRSFLRRPSLHGSLLRAALGLAGAELRALATDLAEAIEPTSRLLALHEGEQNLTAASAVAVFVHFAPSPVVSDMVLRRVERLGALGFAVVFVSMAPALPEAGLARLLRLCAVVVQRRNHGLDFGAWHDLVPLLRARAPAIDELLLVNDSVCGPFRSEAAVLQSLRRSGAGLFGLTENLAPQPHLQSYFLLARGKVVVRDLLRFLDAFQVTASKRRTIRTGEIRLSGWMRRRGHLVAAFCGYELVERVALRRATARQRLRALYPFLFRDVPEGGPMEALAMARALRHRPVNPTHVFWRELVEECGFPFVKTDLLLRNPLGLSDRLDWRTLLSPRDHAFMAMVEAHLGSQAGQRPATAASP